MFCENIPDLTVSLRFDFTSCRRSCQAETGRQGPTLLSSYDELLEKTADKQCKFSMGLGSSLTYAASGRYCGTLVVTGRPFFEGGLSFVLPKGSNFTAEISNVTLQMKAGGSLPSLEDTLRGQGSCRQSTDPVLTFEKLRTFFFLAYSACVVLFLEMVMDPQNIKNGRVESDVEAADCTIKEHIETVVEFSSDGKSERMPRDI